MRIGTWNLANDWGRRQLSFLENLDCDVLLLTEVPRHLEIPGLDVHTSTLRMGLGQYWAAVASRVPMRPLPDPHATSAMAQIDGRRFCASVLPWNGARKWWPESADTEAELTALAVAAVDAAKPDVWGGDWNHSLFGPVLGSKLGRTSIAAAVERLGLTVATKELPHSKIEEAYAIDHLALPAAWAAEPAQRHVAVAGGARLSDHDAYVVEATAD